MTVVVSLHRRPGAMPCAFADESVCIRARRPPRKAISRNPRSAPAAEITLARTRIHPATAFLSGEAQFAEIGRGSRAWPSSAGRPSIRIMGDKIAAKVGDDRGRVPCVPGSEGALTSIAEAKNGRQKIGFPGLVKASAGWRWSRHEVARTEADLLKTR